MGVSVNSLFRGITERFTNDIAIDLGTSSTLIYVKGKGIELREPSIVTIDELTHEVVAVGTEAKRMLGRTPEGIRVIRPMKDGVIADFGIVEIMLKTYIGMVQRKKLFVRPRVIVCVPSGITEVEKRAVRDSIEASGAREIYLVSEPIAAAIGVGLPVEAPTGNMIIDIGAARPRLPSSRSPASSTPRRSALPATRWTKPSSTTSRRTTTSSSASRRPNR